jgi:hypothetical protein
MLKGRYHCENGDTGIDNDSVMEGPEFYARMGGIICKTCK